MEEETCKYFKYGYCKYKNECRIHHLKETCEMGSSCKTSKVCMKRHPKICKLFSEGGFCRHGDKCAYSHTNKKAIDNQKEMDVLNMRVESLEKVVQEMARTLFFLQTKLINQEGITNDDIEADSHVANSKKNIDDSTLEHKSEDKNVEINEGTLKCEIVTIHVRK